MSETTPSLAPAILSSLSSFDAATRREALAAAAAELKAGRIVPPPENGWVNIHAHTFFSYSSEGFSPGRLAWEARMRGLSVIGSTDFDVLDAMEEMLAAGRELGIRATVALETRTFVDDYADREINSPGEPGVMYTMGVGFVRFPDPAAPEGKLFASLAAQAGRRNRVMVEKVNSATAPVTVDYEQDVLPLTPSGNATERHICAAYDAKAREHYPAPAALLAYWAGTLGKSPDDMPKLLANVGALRNAIRAKLMKKGGVGYTQPGSGAFPPVRDFFRMVAAARAIPCLAWLDGSSAGEMDPARFLDDGMGWGARAVNVIPDRNWNFADPNVKEKRLAALDECVHAARARNLPILAGTEMNSPGQKFVDSFDAPELAPYVNDFRDAASWLYGHTLLEREAGKGVMSAWANREFGSDWASANAFYVLAGKQAEPAVEYGAKLRELGDGAKPEEVLRAL